MPTFEKRSRIEAPAATVFAFHERPDALAMLSAPWQRVTVVQPPRSLAVGTRVILRVGIGPVRQTIVAEHVAYEAGKSFTDQMIKGPFARWVHTHTVTPDGDAASFLTDSVDYTLPLGPLGALFGGAIARHELARLFEYRHGITRSACEPASEEKRAKS